MRLRCPIARGASSLALVVLLASSSGCQSMRRTFRATPVDVEQPPADVAPPQEQAAPPQEQAAPPQEQADPPQEQADPPQEQADPPQERADPPQDQGTPPQAKPPPPPQTPPPASPPPPSPSVPEIDQVSTVESRQPQLLTGGEQPSPDTLEARLAEAERLSGVLRGRALTAEQSAQVDSGRAFLEDARQALQARDLTRAQVLVDKSLALLAAAERATRP